MINEFSLEVSDDRKYLIRRLKRRLEMYMPTAWRGWQLAVFSEKYDRAITLILQGWFLAGGLHGEASPVRLFGIEVGPDALDVRRRKVITWRSLDPSAQPLFEKMKEYAAANWPEEWAAQQQTKKAVRAGDRRQGKSDVPEVPPHPLQERRQIVLRMTLEGIYTVGDIAKAIKGTLDTVSNDKQWLRREKFLPKRGLRRKKPLRKRTLN
jgi:hypothetical protein